MTIKRFRSLALVLMAVAMIGLTLGTSVFRADAGPKAGVTQYRAAAIDEGGTVRNVVLLDQDTYTMANTTPVAGDPVCIEGDPDLFAARLTLTGTLAGTNPVLTIVLQSSDDGGTTWTAVGSSFAAINATVTPTGGKERTTFADSELGAQNTPVVWGNCFRVQYTWAGTGTVTGNVGVTMHVE